MTKQETHQEMR